MKVLIALAFFVVGAFAESWMTSTRYYRTASHDVRMAAVIGVGVFFFLLACGAMNARKQSKAAKAKPATSYAFPARHR